MKKLAIALFAVSAAQAPAWATHGLREAAIPVSNSEVALAMIASNPPLPMTFFEKGDYKITGMFDYLSVDKPAQIASEAQPVSDVSNKKAATGWGGAALAEYATTERFSFYAMLMSVSIGSGELTGLANATTRSQIASSASNAPGQIFQRSVSDSNSSIIYGAGVNLRIKGDSPERFTLAAFTGPMILQSKGTGVTTILETGVAANASDCNESFSNYNCVKRKYSADETNTLFIGGIQAGFPIGRFTLNPYIMTFLGIESHAKAKYDIPLNGGNGVLTSEADYERGISPYSLGLNATYRPWGLTFNVLGGLAAPIIASGTNLTDFKIFKLQISKSFGKYTK